MTGFEANRKVVEETEQTLAASRQALDCVQMCLDRTSVTIERSQRLLSEEPKHNRRKTSRRAKDSP